MDEEKFQQKTENSSGSIGLSEESTEVPHLTYEETPVIEPTNEPSYSASPTPKTSTSKPISFLKALIGFVILFIIGFAVSGIVRQMLSTTPQSTETTAVLPTPTPIESMKTISSTETTQSGVLVNSSWKTYPVVNGLTRKAIDGISFQLPSDIQAPTCDGGNCASQGTYLSGGTRFTVAPRGQGQVLADYRSRAISDLRGNAFTVKETTLQGKRAVEFSGDFTGSTAQGFGFTRMHGFMVEVTDTMSLEMNHFVPSNTTADFEKDDVLFNQIVKTISFTILPSTIVTTTTTPLPTMTVTPSTTSSGVMMKK